MTTARTLISDALQDIQVLGPGEAVSSDEASKMLRLLNSLIDSWSAEGGIVFTETRESFTLSAGTSSYTIGSGATFNTARPVRIVSAFTRSGTTDTPLILIDQSRYAEISVKSEQSSPVWYLYYDAAYNSSGYGNIILHPVPSTADTLFLYSEKPLSTLATLDTTLVFPPGHERFYRSNLAVEAAPSYERTPSSVLMKIAEESKSAIVKANFYNDDWLIKADTALQSDCPYNLDTGYRR